MKLKYKILIFILFGAYTQDTRCAQIDSNGTGPKGTTVTVQCAEDDGNSTPQGREIALLDCALNDREQREQYANTFCLPSKYFPDNLLPNALENIISEYVGSDIKHLALSFLRRPSDSLEDLYPLLEQQVPSHLRTVPGTTIKTILNSLSELVGENALKPGLSTITLSRNSTNRVHYEYFDAESWNMSTKHNYLLDRPLFLDQHIIEDLTTKGLRGFIHSEGRSVRIIFPSADTTAIPVEKLWEESGTSYQLVGALYANTKEPEETIALMRTYKYQLAKNFSIYTHEQADPRSWWEIIKSHTINIAPYSRDTAAYELFRGAATYQNKLWRPIALFYRKFKFTQLALDSSFLHKATLSNTWRDNYNTTIKHEIVSEKHRARIAALDRLSHNANLIFWISYNFGAAYCYYKKPQLLTHYSVSGHFMILLARYMTILEYMATFKRNRQEIANTEQRSRSVSIPSPVSNNPRGSSQVPNTWRDRLSRNKNLIFWSGYTFGAAYCYYKKPQLFPHYVLSGYLMSDLVL